MKIEGKLIKSGKWWAVEIPLLLIHTQGKTKKEAFRMAADAVKAIIDEKGFKVTVTEGPDNTFSVGSNKDTLLMLIQYKRPDETLVLGPGGRPAGDVEDRGTVTFLGRELPKHVLVFEGKDKSLFLGDRFENIEFYIQLDDEAGPAAVNYEAIDIPKKIQAEMDQILESFEYTTTD